jgi:hypothetical protein
MQILLKQSSSAVDVLSDVFKLTDEEKKRLGQFPVGQGLFFAGQNHVHIQVVASPTETGLITTNPQQVQAMKQGDMSQASGTIDLENKLYPGSTNNLS